MKVLELTFATESGKTSRITVEAPKENVTAAEVRTAMETLVAEEVFVNAEGSPIKEIKSARIVERTVSDLFTE